MFLAPEARLAATLGELVGGNIDVTPGFHHQIAAGAHRRSGYVDRVRRGHIQAVAGSNGSRLLAIGTTELDIAPAAVIANTPLLSAGDVIDATAGAYQLQRFRRYRRTNVIDIARRAQVKTAIRADKSGVKVAEAITAVNGKAVSRQQRTAAVADIAPCQLHGIAADYATVPDANVLRRQVNFRHHHGPTIKRCGLPPQNAAIERRHLCGGERHAKRQAKRGLHVGRVVHQITHLIEIRAEAIKIA
ncbi:Uncharacterised protein [Klebsiella variicola]|nr:Uncharacterised protein [Klebsiella variicola]SXG13489.1 Uncharacterised protein [Klebsiella variicola]